MLHGDGNKNGIKINRSNQQKTKTKTKQNKTKKKLHARAAQSLFFLICKETDLHVQHTFCISLPFLHNCNAVLWD